MNEASIPTQGYLMGVSSSSNCGYCRCGFDNGMSMLFLLSDGTFLVYDGGQGASDAHHLFGMMRRLSKQYALEKISVSAWIMTHYHRDHRGFLEYFLESYKDRVEIREFWYHSIERGDVENTMQAHCPQTPIRHLEMGERVRLFCLRRPKKLFEKSFSGLFAGELFGKKLPPRPLKNFIAGVER